MHADAVRGKEFHARGKEHVSRYLRYIAYFSTLNAIMLLGLSRYAFKVHLLRTPDEMDMRSSPSPLTGVGRCVVLVHTCNAAPAHMDSVRHLCLRMHD